MAWVCRSSCLGAARADLLGIQLTAAFRLILSHSVRSSLRHPIGDYSHRICRRRRRFGGPNRPRHMPSRLARSDDLLPHFLDSMRSFQRRRHPLIVHGVFHRSGHRLQRFGGPDHPRRLSLS